ncbi:centromere-associated protein E [Dorcoceras hygrometricum]|uniref:Centromere-associated protein E n=1 Tax=Dorcoceras hygrometricum TaxID=472368 RepID=A0A2Z7AI38_9LAMI|nr:centromere-associated protein E [Dorcoceras hygrometricum]
MRKDMRDHKTALSVDVVKSQHRISTQLVAAAFDNVDVRKEVKEINAKVTELDGQVATIRSELLDFRAQAQENYNNLSSQLGELVSYIIRGNDKKGEDSSSRRPQPPPDDQNRPGGGSGSRPDDQSRYGGVSVSRDVETRGSGSESRRRGDKSGSKRIRSSGGGESPVRGIFYGPYLPLKRDAEYWITGKK